MLRNNCIVLWLKWFQFFCSLFARLNCLSPSLRGVAHCFVPIPQYYTRFFHISAVFPRLPRVFPLSPFPCISLHNRCLLRVATVVATVAETVSHRRCVRFGDCFCNDCGNKLNDGVCSSFCGTLYSSTALRRAAAYIYLNKHFFRRIIFLFVENQQHFKA